MGEGSVDRKKVKRSGAGHIVGRAVVGGVRLVSDECLCSKRECDAIGSHCSKRFQSEIVIVACPFVADSISIVGGLSVGRCGQSII